MTGRGRPVIGPAVTVRLDPPTLERIDERARTEGVKRAEWIRTILTRELNR